jgi:hypothetical protein
MLRFGICTPEQFLRVGERRRYSGARVNYGLLDVGDHPTAQQIGIFEDVSFTLRTSNGIFRTTFRHRFSDVNEMALRLMRSFYPLETELRVQDRAASHGLTSWEWAEQLLPVYPRAEFEGSDLLLYLFKISLRSGETYIVEPDGKPLQYMKPPFVVALHDPESWRYPVNRAIATCARRKFQQLNLPQDWMSESNPAKYTVTRIPFVHPEARSFSLRNPRFQFRSRSVFEITPAACHVLRTMNIFNKSYFSAEQLAEGVNAAFHSIKPGGFWIVGRTLEEDLSNHATFLRRLDNGWEVLERIGKGSDIEELAMRVPVSIEPHVEQR